MLLWGILANKNDKQLTTCLFGCEVESRMKAWAKEKGKEGKKEGRREKERKGRGERDFEWITLSITLAIQTSIFWANAGAETKDRTTAWRTPCVNRSSC